MKRRVFLGGLAASAGSVLAACNSRGPQGAKDLLRAIERGNEGLERALFSPGSHDAVAADASLTGSAFPRYWVSRTMPTWDPAVRGIWRLEVGGAVRKPVSLSLDDLVAMRGTTQRHNHYCVEGWTARAEFTGVRVSELARLVQPTADAGYVDFRSFDSEYHESWDLDSAMHPQTVVAYATDGRYLNAAEGAPARVHSPVKLGYKNTKYLTQVLFLPTRTGGYWSDQGYEWYGGV
ncbi:MAG: molybdopterin-dependent oxidoreductase [Cytophagaceae bacterium]|nr:molybdopterin-dependent oxidoreductase [Gemmatimonadaceae bacterium]